MTKQQLQQQRQKNRGSKDKKIWTKSNKQTKVKTDD